VVNTVVMLDMVACLGGQAYSHAYVVAEELGNFLVLPYYYLAEVVNSPMMEELLTAIEAYYLQMEADQVNLTMFLMVAVVDYLNYYYYYYWL
jgi:hypothetical protein